MHLILLKHILHDNTFACIIEFFQDNTIFYVLIKNYENTDKV